MINYIYHNGNKYPSWQAEGNAARWIMPLAQYHCVGKGLDIGASKKEWAMPGAFIIDPAVDFSNGDAMNIRITPEGSLWDYIFSSHMLEHLQGNWADCLDYWLSKLRDDGVLFLYLPHNSQSYWNPTSNRKHVHSFDGAEIRQYLQSLGYEPYLTPVDYNNSFAVVCYKAKVADEDERLCRAAAIAEEIMKADECEKYCKERGIDYIREGNNVIYNEPFTMYSMPVAKHGIALENEMTALRLSLLKVNNGRRTLGYPEFTMDEYKAILSK